MTIGEKIRELRLKNNMTQYELALKLGYMTKGAIARIEKNTRELPISKLCEIAKIFNTTPNDIVGWRQHII